jgi:hypothetical protein
MDCARTDCPLLEARRAGEVGGIEAEAHVLRVRLAEQIHKLALTRQRLRALGVDPDTAYVPHDQGSQNA